MKKREYLRGIVPDSYIDYHRPPPIEFPLSEGEIENFPRHLTEVERENCRKKFLTRRWHYRGECVQIASNARRQGHGIYIIILIPETFEKIVAQIELGPGYKKVEVAEALRQMYYLGKKLAEIETDVSSKTITRYLQAAERTLDVLGQHRSRPLKISLKAITLSFKVLRYGRDAWLDVRRYFPDRIF